MNEQATEQLEQIQQIYNIIVEFLVNYSFQLIGAMLVFLIGAVIAKRIANVVESLCERKKLDITLSRFIANVVKIIVLVMIAIICLNMIGISITPFIAAIGALGLGAGLAVQGLLANYGAGFNIILTRPFVVNDTIQVKGVLGVVKEIRLAFTLLEDEDGAQILVPNRHIVGEILHNSHATSLVETSVGVAYNSDIANVLAVLTEALHDSDLVANIPAPQIGIGEFADSAIQIQFRYWAPTEKMYSTRFAINRLIWNTLQQHHVVVPFPQHEVRVLANDSTG